MWEDGEVFRRLAAGWKAEVLEGESGSLLRVSDIADKLESKAWSCRSLRVQQRGETLQLSTFICVQCRYTLKLATHRDCLRISGVKVSARWRKGGPQVAASSPASIAVEISPSAISTG